MYLALIIFQIGIGMSLSFIHIGLTAPITLIVLHYFVVKKEEVYLEITFGDIYKNYKTKSRRWI